MTLYEIDERISALVDPETGEIADYEAFEQLQMDRDAKLENIGLWIKDLKAEAAAIKAEIASQQERAKSAERKAERLEGYLMQSLAGQKFSTPKVAISFRNSTSTFIENEEMFLVHYPQFARVKTELDRAALKDALKKGEHYEGACLENRTSMIVK